MFKAGATDQGAAAVEPTTGRALPRPPSTRWNRCRPRTGRWKGSGPSHPRRPQADEARAVRSGSSSTCGSASAMRARGARRCISAGAHDQGVDGVDPRTTSGSSGSYVQAKRFESLPVTPHDVRDFIGALALQGGDEGCLHDDVDLHQGRDRASRRYDGQTDPPDGTALAGLMIEHGVGMSETGDASLPLRIWLLRGSVGSLPHGAPGGPVLGAGDGSRRLRVVLLRYECAEGG